MTKRMTIPKSEQIGYLWYIKNSKKSLGILVGILFIGLSTMAQPSDAAILKFLNSKADKSKLISMKLIGKRGTAVREVENRMEVSNFYRSYQSKFKTQYAGVTGVYRGAIKYGYRGGGWKYIQKLVGDNSYEGIENPKWSELEVILKKNLGKTIGFDYSKIVGDLKDFRLADDPKWTWYSPTSVEFTITMTYSRKISNTELETVRQEYKIRLYADKYKGPWKDTFLSTTGKAEKLSVKKYSSEELKSMRTLREKDIEERNKAEVANLPDVAIPLFANHGQLVGYFHRLMMNADGPTIEANLRKLLTSGYYDANLKTVLNDRGVALINNTIEVSKRYRQQYCKKPQLKHNQANMIEWYNKDASTYSRLSSMDFGNGRRGISEISLSVLSGENAKILAAKACKVRSNPIKRMRATKLKTSVGSYVFCRYGSSQWSYVAQLTGSGNGKYNVKYLDGSTGTAVPDAVCNFELIPGDIVYMKNSSGEIVSRWVTQNNGTTVIQVEDLNGRVSSVHLKDLRFM